MRILQVKRLGFGGEVRVWNRGSFGGPELDVGISEQLRQSRESFVVRVAISSEAGVTDKGKVGGRGLVDAFPIAQQG